MIIITLTKLGKNINAKIFDNTRNLEVNYYEDSSNLTLVYNVQNNTVTLTIKATTSYTTPNINTNNCLYFVNLTGFGTTLIDDKINFDFFYPDIFPATSTTPTTPGIDDVLAVGQVLSADRNIDGDGDAFRLSLIGLLQFFATGNGNGFFGYYDTNQISILNNTTGTTPSAINMNTASIEFIVDSIGLFADNNSLHRSAIIGDTTGLYNNVTIGADDYNNTIIATGSAITTTTAGGAAGKHLKININGTNYKIALLNP